jgi:hypothetical protein
MSGYSGKKSSGKSKAKAKKNPGEMGAAAVCALASHGPIAEAIAKLGPVTGRGEVLDQSDASPATLLAGEQVSHLTEAWQYMGAAVRAVLCNAGDNATHFAYYAQLRAVLSIFAGSGIRVSLGKSFLVDQHGNKVAFELPKPVNRTHPMVWSLWDEWVKTPYAHDLMGKNMPVIAGISLSDLALIPASSSALLGAWGYDLARGDKDHTARNNASYKAHSRVASPDMDLTSIDLVRRIWTLLLENGGGVVFDATLVRYFVERYLASAVEQGAKDASIVDRASILERVIEQTSAKTGVSKSMLAQVFNADVDTKLFEHASAAETNVENVVSRALFLLRIATLALAEGLRTGANQHCKNWLAFWLQSGGLYDPDIHDAPSEISTDYEGALEELDDLDPARLPASVWSRGLAESSALLARPEGFVGWALPL